MIDKRLDLLEDYLEDFFADSNFVISKASDDASFRRYFRIERDNSTFIAMDAPTDKEDSKPFVKISSLLNSNKVHAPKIINKDLDKGFLLIEDLGNVTMLDSIKSEFNLDLYKIAIDEIIKIQQIETQNLQSYNQELLMQEMQLLIDWYLPKDLQKTTTDELLKCFEILADNALNSKQVFVHRDYHSRNLMVLNNKELGVIDFQDAVIGSNTYDLVSLLKDAYFELKPTEVQALLTYFYKQAKLTIDFNDFEKQFDLMGLQRHLKILGIFKRLSKRDGKHQYLNDIPLVKKYTLQTADKYSEFGFLKELL